MQETTMVYNSMQKHCFQRDTANEVLSHRQFCRASFKRGKGEVGMDEYQVRTWHGWHHHMALSLMAVWFLITETHRGQQVTPALTLPQVRYGLSLLLLEVYCTPGVEYICRHVQRQLQRNEAARFYHHRTRKCMPPRKLHRYIQ